MCDLALTYLLEQLERHYLAERQVTATLVAAGAQGDLPVWQIVKAEWLEALQAAPAPVSARERRLRMVLGVA